MRKIIVSQFILLLAGMIFAWGNFSLELWNWLNKQACTTGCSAGLANPFLTPCFYGAIFFLLAFILSAMLLRKSGQK
jgi:hypothetical protein